MKRQIAIIDTGLRLTLPTQALWEGFEYYTYDLLGGGEIHPHGHFVSALAMRPFDVDERRQRVVFHHIRAGDRTGQFSLEAVCEALRLVQSLRCTAYNCSWGMSDMDLPQYENLDEMRKAWAPVLELIEELAAAGICGHWASGNGDNNLIIGGDLDDDVAFPQRLLPRGGMSLIWGSLKKDGRASNSSGDGGNVFGCFWGEKVPMLEPSGRYAHGTGTSLTSPKGCGTCEVLLAMESYSDYKAVEMGLISMAVHKTKLSGEWCDYLNPDTGERHHPKFGWGTLEPLYQSLTVGARSRPPMVLAATIRPRIHWVNFTPMR